VKKMNRFKLIAFDLDGVLVDGPGSWFEVHKAVGTYKHSREHGSKFYAGEITFDEWAQKDAELWRGIKREKIKEVLYNVKLMTGAEETINRLKELGYKTAIISGGLQILVDRVRDELGIDYAFANKLIFNDEKVCGIDQVVDFTGKGDILKMVAEKNRIDTRECAAVGDYLNDIPLFKAAGFSIAFNPKDDELLKFADAVIREKDLTKILPYLEDGH